jgi:hypothetical protein
VCFASDEHGLSGPRATLFYVADESKRLLLGNGTIRPQTES